MFSYLHTLKMILSIPLPLFNTVYGSSQASYKVGMWVRNEIL